MGAADDSSGCQQVCSNRASHTHIANLEITEAISAQIGDLLSGIYMGTCSLEGRQYGSVMSIGYNPYYNNTQRSLEVHLFGEFAEDFYGTDLDVTIATFIRVESDFKSFDHLIRFINNDIYIGKQRLP